MPRPGFYNDNEYRAYPFIFSAGQELLLPNSAVVDCGIIMGLDSEFDPKIHTVWLEEVIRDGNTFSFALHTDAPGAQNCPLVFTRNINTDEWQSEYVESAPYVKDINSCATEPVWSGFLVTGPLTDLNDKLPTSGTISLSKEFTLEPGRIQSLVRSYLRSITVANMERPRALSACDEEQNTTRKVIINSRCVSGNIKFKEGYNAIVDQRDSANEINISAGRNAGVRPDGNLCENGSELPFYDNEQPPILKSATETEPEVRSKFFSGGPACDELISSINGVQGPDVNIAAGTGINIKIDPENPNTIRVSLSDVNIAGNC